MRKKYSTIGSSIIVLENEHDANLTCIELKNSLIFIDTGRSYDVAAAFREEMEKRFNKKTSHLFITHYHFDHYGGVSAFKDAEIVAAKAGFNQFVTDINFHLTKNNRKKYVENWKNQIKLETSEISPSRLLHWEYFPKADFYYPTIIVEDEFEYSDDSRKIIFKVTGGHSKCSAYVYFSEERAILIGDNLATDPRKGDKGSLGYSMLFYRLGMSERTIEILDEIRKLPVDTVIPGHGPITTIENVSNIVEYFKELFEIIKSMYREGVNPTKVSSDSRLARFYDKELENWDSIIEQQYRTITKEETIIEVCKRKKTILESIVQKSINNLLLNYSETAEFILPGGFVIKGIDNFRDEFSCFNEITEHRFEAEEYYFLEDKIIETGRYHAVFINEKGMMNYEKHYIFFWVKENKTWKISMDFVITERVY